MNHELTHIDLFSGIGGFALAARWAGFRTICFSEIDPYASAVLRKHWPDVPNLGDIKTADFSPYAGATVLTGGFPCQPFSCAGKQRGASDDRFLWPRMLEVVAAVKPAWIVGENVAGIIRMELDRVLADLESKGYDALPIVIPACAVDAKHQRNRVWIVANANADREPQSEGIKPEILERAVNSRQAIPNPESEQASWEGQGRFLTQPTQCCRWESEPAVGRVAHGIPRRVDRLKCLGNAIVPQVAFQILKAIACIEKQFTGSY